jgi:hypothetical protein
MRKGINALELVFGMFILIVVTLVVIRLFTNIVTPETLPSLDDFRKTYNYERELSKCSSACSPYTTSGCEDLSAAVTFCQQKIGISIDGNEKGSEKGHFGVVRMAPYCEDGLYCFHISDCGCGGYILDATTCKEVMYDYYKYTIGYSEQTTNEVICKSIPPGTCKTDPRTWGEKYFERIQYRPQTALGSDAQYGVGDPPVIGADYWWKAAGYGEICKGITPSGGTTTTAPSLQLSCSNPLGTNDIKCSWSGCSGNSEVIVAISKGVGLCNPVGDKRASGDCTVSNVAAGSYNAVLDCDDLTLPRSVTVILV